MLNSKTNSLQYKTEIKNNFESLDNNGIIEIQQLDDLINIINSKNKNPFLFNFIKSLTVLKKQENEEGISYEEYISYLDNILNDNNSKDGLKNIFNVFCNADTGNISWTTFPLIARELGEKEISEKLLEKLNQSKLYTKDLNFNEFYELMNNENEDPNSKNIEISENSENINISNLKINEEVKNYEEKPTYKQRKRMKKQIESDKTYSSKNSVQENDDDIIVEEKSYNNQREDSNTDNDRSNKRYHRRYRSKKVKNYNNNENIENESNNINNHKSYIKYRKNHFNY